MPANPDDPAAMKARIAELEAQLAAALALPHEDPLPPKFTADGTHNRAYYQERYQRLNRMMEVSLAARGVLPKGYKQALDGLEKEIRFAGFTLTQVMDPRSDDERLAGVREAFLKDPASLLEQAETKLRAVRTQVQAAVEHTEQLIADLQKDADANAEKYRALGAAHPPKASALAGQARLGRRWLRLLDETIELQEMCRHEVPPFVLKRDPDRIDAWKGSRITRFMVYVFRSDDTERGSDVIEAAPHVCKWGFDIWKARRGAKVLPRGHRLKPEGGLVEDIVQCDGIFLAGPPRHSKTTVAIAAVALFLCLNPRAQWKTTHFVDAKAEANLAHIARCFDAQLPAGANPAKYQSTPQGRRCFALFPDLPRKARRDNNAGSLRLDVPETTVAPQCKANGVSAGIAGENTEGILADDVCDRKVADEATTRERVFKDFTQKWLVRHQGPKPFTIYPCTIWHDEDVSSHLRRLAVKGEIAWAVSQQFVGGPKSKPPFHHLWDAYPPERLKRIFAQMRDELGYSAQYMGDPHPESRRIIKRLAYYLARAEEGAAPTPAEVELLRQHQDFLKICRGHTSLDPAATAKATSDEAGIVHLATGPVITDHEENGVRFRRVRRVGRVLDAEEVRAQPLAAIMHLALYTQTHKTDVVHVETVAFSQLIADHFRAAFNLGARQVVDHPTKNLDKPTRLKAVSPMVDDSQRDFGQPGAVVEFPAVLLASGEIVPDPRFAWLEKQILSAGQGGKDHALDAFTQVCDYIRHEVDVGVGGVSEQIRVKLAELDDGRPERFRGQAFRLLPPPTGTAAAEECVQFMEVQ